MCHMCCTKTADLNTWEEKIEDAQNKLVATLVFGIFHTT